MKKYIDTDKLIKLVDNYQEGAKAALNPIDGYADYYKGKIDACEGIQEIITFLQQEQPEVALIYKPNMTISEMVDSINGKQPEVDLEKFTEKVNTFKARYKHPEIVSIKGAMAFMARLFYQYPNVARQWYEQLPKATMD